MSSGNFVVSNSLTRPIHGAVHDSVPKLLCIKQSAVKTRFGQPHIDQASSESILALILYWRAVFCELFLLVSNFSGSSSSIEQTSSV